MLLERDLYFRKHGVSEAVINETNDIRNKIEALVVKRENMITELKSKMKVFEELRQKAKEVNLLLGIIPSNSSKGKDLGDMFNLCLSFAKDNTDKIYEESGIREVLLKINNLEKQLEKYLSGEPLLVVEEFKAKKKEQESNVSIFDWVGTKSVQAQMFV